MDLYLPGKGSIIARQGIYICLAMNLYLPGNESIFVRQWIYICQAMNHICQAMDLYLPGNVFIFARQWIYICQAMWGASPMPKESLTLVLYTSRPLCTLNSEQTNVNWSLFIDAQCIDTFYTLHCAQCIVHNCTIIQISTVCTVHPDALCSV